jgi:hypothetical protein
MILFQDRNAASLLVASCFQRVRLGLMDDLITRLFDSSFKFINLNKEMGWSVRMVCDFGGRNNQFLGFSSQVQ